MHTERMRGDARVFLHLTAGFWLGIYAARTYVPAAVWNVSDALPLYLKGVIAIGVHLLGIAGGVVVLQRRRPRVSLAIVLSFAVVSVLRQLLLGADMPGAVLSMISWIMWLAWFAHASRLPGRLMAPAFAAAFALQILTQWLWHGLDVPMARGPLAWTIVIALSAIFSATHTDADQDESSWAMIALGPAFFLELTLLANAGRMAIGDATNHLALAAMQVVVVLMIAMAAGHRTRRSMLVYAIGGVSVFALLFAFYNRYEWPLMWRVAGLMLIGSAVSARIRFDRLTSLCAIVLASLWFLPRQQHSAPTHQAKGQEVRVATYNIHQGFDNYGAPAVDQIVAQVDSMNADVIALQEVNRGWTFMGGVDLVAYLQYRFPDYQFEFVPVNGDLCGVVLMSRLPIGNIHGARFDGPRTDFGYGYASGDVDVSGVALHVVGVHLSAGLEGDGTTKRTDQAEQLLVAAGSHERTVIVGDFNSEPDAPPIQRIVAAGYRDEVGHVFSPRVATWPAKDSYEHDDYVFTRGAVRMTRGRIPATPASDHLPVVADLRLNARAATDDHAVDKQ